MDTKQTRNLDETLAELSRRPSSAGANKAAGYSYSEEESMRLKTGNLG